VDRRLAEPVLRTFRQEVSGPSPISVFDRDTMVVARPAREPDVISLMSPAGFRLPPMASIGRLCLPFAARDATGSSRRSRQCSSRRWAMDVPMRHEHRAFAGINLMMLRNAVTAETGVKQRLKPPHKAAPSVALILRYDLQQHTWRSGWVAH